MMQRSVTSNQNQIYECGDEVCIGLWHAPADVKHKLHFGRFLLRHGEELQHDLLQSGPICGSVELLK